MQFVATIVFTISIGSCRSLSLACNKFAKQQSRESAVELIRLRFNTGKLQPCWTFQEQLPHPARSDVRSAASTIPSRLMSPIPPPPPHLERTFARSTPSTIRLRSVSASHGVQQNVTTVSVGVLCPAPYPVFPVTRTPRYVGPIMYG